MLNFQDIRISTWAFLEVYGWITLIIMIFTYVMYKKYIYNLTRAQAEKRRINEQEKFDIQVKEKERNRIRLTRERQQREHNEKEKSERIKRELKGKEEIEKRRRELEEQKKICQVLGHHPPSTPSTVLSSSPNATKNPHRYAIEIADNLPGSASITIFGYSTCPDFRKVCQLVSTYRLDTSKVQAFEFDKQPGWPVDELLQLFDTRFKTKKSPLVFICGEYIGGLAETRMYDRTIGLNKL